MNTHFDSDTPLISDLNLVSFNSRSSNPVQQTLGKAPVFSASPVPALPSILSSSPSAFTPTSSSPLYFLSRPLNTNMSATATTDSDVDNDEVQSIDIESVKGRKGKNGKASAAASTSSNKKKRHRTWLADELKTLWNAVYSKKPHASDAAKLKQWAAVSNELAKEHTDIDWNQRSVQRNWEDSIAAACSAGRTRPGCAFGLMLTRYPSSNAHSSCCADRSIFAIDCRIFQPIAPFSSTRLNAASAPTQTAVQLTGQ